MAASEALGEPEAEPLPIEPVAPPYEAGLLPNVEVLPVVLGGFLALLAVGTVGLLIGFPIGLALGRVLWRLVAGIMPLEYAAPVALLALLLLAPVAVLTANALAAWPGRQAARLRIGHVLRAE